ncbi:MAG: hypothetical protein ACI4JE_04505 [Ruminococcus sp.]
MKRYLILLGALSLILTSCGRTVDDTAQVEDNASSTVKLSTVNETDKYYSADGVELNIDMSQYSGNAKLLTGSDIYLLSYDCGYISGNHPGALIIENEEQLDYVMERYGLALPPDGLTEDELWDYSTAISEPFNDMIAEYPVSDYSYVIEYEEVSCGGYYLKVGALLVDKDSLRFVRTADSKTPDGDEQPEVMGGFCYMAAIPKGVLMNEHYEGWTYPETTDIGDAYYKAAADKDIVIDEKTGVQYVRNQLLISAFADTEKTEIEKIADELNADIVGCIELTGDYQIEFQEEKSLEKLEEIADYINSYPFISNVTLNMVSQSYPDAEGNDNDDNIIPENKESQTVKDGYIAVFHSDEKNMIHETYIYKIDNDAENYGFDYINVVRNRVTESDYADVNITGQGSVQWTDDVFKAAKDNKAYSYVTMPDDEKNYTIDEFMNMFLMN